MSTRIQIAPTQTGYLPPDARASFARPVDLVAALVQCGDLIPTPIVITRAADGLILYANLAFGRLHCLPTTQLVGRYAPDFYAHPADRQRFLRRLARAGMVQDFEVEGIRAGDGAHLWLSLDAKRVIFDGQEALLTTLRDVARQHDIQDELTASEQRLRLLAENAQDAVFRFELRPTPHFSYLSPATTHLTGYTPDEFYASPTLIYRLLRREQVEQLAALLDSGRQRLDPQEHLLRRKDKTQIWLECHYRLIYDDHSTLIAFEGIARDITERKRSEEQSRLAAMGQLAAGIAHDFNNTLSVILLHMELVRRLGPLTDGQKHHLTMINEQVHHATNLVQQVLDFCRRTVVERKTLDLVSFAETLVRQWEQILAKNIKIEFFSDQLVCLVHADPSRLQQALLNLMINARDAMPTGGVLRVHVSAIEVGPGDEPPVPEMQPGSWVVLNVSDSGIGMTAAVLAHLFEPFYTTKAPGAGTGLGLAQVYGIVKQHEGHIRVMSEVGQGTTVCLYLPQLLEAIQLAPEQASVAPQVRLAGTSVLLVEDNEATRQGLQDALELLGCQVIATTDGETALDILRQQQGHIDVLLSDLVIPNLDGLELVRQFTTSFPQLRTVLLTGHPLHPSLEAALEEQQVTWLQKPVHLETLALTLEAVLDRG